jgi:hypothetical protein
MRSTTTSNTSSQETNTRYIINIETHQMIKKFFTLQKNAGDEFTINDLLHLASWGILPLKRPSAFLTSLALAGKMRAIIHEPISYNSRKLPNTQEMLDSIQRFEGAVKFLLETCLNKNQHITDTSRDEENPQAALQLCDENTLENINNAWNGQVEENSFHFTTANLQSDQSIQILSQKQILKTNRHKLPRVHTFQDIITDLFAHECNTLRENLVSACHGLYISPFIKRQCENLRYHELDAIKNTLLDQISMHTLLPQAEATTQLRLKIPSSPRILARELHRLTLANLETTDIDLSQLNEHSVRFSIPQSSVLPALQRAKTQQWAKVLIDLSIIPLTSALSSYVTDTLREPIKPLGWYPENWYPQHIQETLELELWMLICAAAMVIGLVLNTQQHCSAVTEDELTDKANTKEANAPLKQFAAISALMIQIKNHQTPIDHFTETLEGIADLLLRTGKNYWRTGLLSGQILLQNLTQLSAACNTQHDADVRQCLAEQPTELTVYQEALLRRALIKIKTNAQLSFQSPQQTATVNTILLMLNHGKTHCFQASRMNIFRPLYRLMIMELAYSMLMQNIAMGAQGVLATSLVGYTAWSYLNNGWARGFGQIFSHGPLWELFSATVMTWQMAVLIPNGSESIGARFGNFIVENFSPLYATLFTVHTLSWLAKEHIAFIGDEVSHKAGSWTAFFQMTVFVKLSVLCLLFMSSKEGNNVVMKFGLGAVHLISLLVASGLALLMCDAEYSESLLQEAGLYGISIASDSITGIFECGKMFFSMLTHGVSQPVLDSARQLPSLREDCRRSIAQLPRPTCHRPRCCLFTKTDDSATEDRNENNDDYQRLNEV